MLRVGRRAMAVAVFGAGLAACGDDTVDHATGGAGGAGTADGAGGAGGTGGVDLPHADPSATRATGALTVGRSHHTATLLEDGRVIVVGGETASGEPLSSVEIFDPVQETWSALPPLSEGRANHTTTLLAGGSLLIVGGGRSNQNGSPSPDGVADTAVVYDPNGEGPGAIVSLGGPRAGHLAFRLASSDVLVVGGSNDEIGSACTSVPDCFYGKALATAELFNGKTATFAPTAAMAGPRMLFGGVLLEDGTPLMVGGASDTASLKRVETFAADDGSFIEMAPLANARLRPVVVSLGSGAVLAAAGKIANVGPVGVTEIYDPSSDQWTDGPDIGEPRTGSAAVTLDSGNALVVGGFNQTTGSELDELLIFDQDDGSWLPITPLLEPRALPTATLLTDGRVLVVGGVGGLLSCEIAE
jgi:Galactose oxidase, central domain